MATVSEIIYHPATYTVEPVKIWNVLDVGRLVNPTVAEGQAEGGVIQALGYALTELCYRKGFGRIQGFTDYALPMSLDIPEIDIEFIHTVCDIKTSGDRRFGNFIIDNKLHNKVDRFRGKRRYRVKILWQALNCAMIISYCRPFSRNDRRSKGKIPDLPKRYLRVLDLHEREIHKTRLLPE